MKQEPVHGTMIPIPLEWLTPDERWIHGTGIVPDPQGSDSRWP